MGEDFQMKFVTPQDGDTNPALIEAFNMLREHGLSPEWISHDQCAQVGAADKNCAYVIDPFQGPAFERLKLHACRVYGAQCILASLHMKVELPQKKRPIYNVAMKGVTVCCTSLDRAVREHVHRLVELMAGETSKNLVTEVTHMVAGEVGSQKYAVAASRGTSIMTVEWVDMVWQTAQHRYVHGTDSQFARLRCPVFKGLVVTVSGLAPGERDKVKRDVENEGGTYTGEMKMNECTHLIVKEPKGQKYNFACKWKIHVVTLRWLYESLDKNYCQDEKQYPVTGTASAGASNVKMSTPENKMADVRPNIIDISAISTNNTHIDETAVTCTRLSYDTTGGSESFESLDLSCVTGGEHFIDSCRLYLSTGVRGALLEKCKKMINIGGATRLNEINENITHVIMEEKVDDEISAVNNLDLRPHVVNSLWLAECFKQGRHVSEEAFLSPHLLLSDLELPKLQVSGRKSQVEHKKSLEVSKGRQAAVSSSSPSSLTTAKGSDKDDGEMVLLLSQYMDESSGQGETTVQPMDEVDGNTSGTTWRQPGHGSKHGATQHPDSEVTAADVTGVFVGKTFVFYGFSEEDVALLTNLTTEAGGVCLKESGRQVADYGVVPLFGCPVKQTVGQVVTNAWLEMCLEGKEVLNVGDHPIFQPLDLNEETRPLKGCVLSVSGYQGVERSCLRHIADALGALYQEHFVRVAKKSLQASTHLITKEPSGQKYNAAKKWNLPTVTKEWLVACARSGRRENEDKFDIDHVNNDPPDPQLIPRQQTATTPLAQPAVATHHQQHTSGSATENSKAPPKAGHSSSVPSDPHSKQVLLQGETGRRSHSRKDGTKQVEAKEARDCSTPFREAARPSPLSKPTFLTQEETTRSNSSLKRKHLTSGMVHSGESCGPGLHSKPTSLLTETHGPGSKAVRTASSSADQVMMVPVTEHPAQVAPPSSAVDTAPSLPSCSADRVSASSASDVDASNPMSSAKAMIEQQQHGVCQLSQKENLTAVVNTATGVLGTPCLPKKLPPHSRLQQSRTSVLSPGVESPSVFMAPGWRPKFDLTAVYEYYKTPEAQQTKDQSDSPSLEELMQYHLAKAVEISSVPQTTANDFESSPKSQCEDRAPLAGVVICVAKKLGVNQAEYNSIVVELGGDYSWQYSPSCTHFIFEGRANDLNKEFRLARGQGKIIVCPHWLYACLEKRIRLEEALYPHTFNPNMNLGSVVRKETPARSLRSVNSNRATCNLVQTKSATPRTPARPGKGAARQKNLEMNKWQAKDSTQATGCGDSSNGSSRKRPGSVVEMASPKRLMTQKAKQKVPESEDSKAGASSSLPSVDDKTLGTECGAQADKTLGTHCGAQADREGEACPDPVLTEVAQESGGSLEIREALCKTLETVKASSSRSKKFNKRRNRRTDQNSSGDQANLSGKLPDAVSHHASPWETRHHTQDGVHTAESLGAEASQSVQITWDDPTGRREKEKLAHKLDMVCGPSQYTPNTEDLMANMDMPDETTSPPIPKQEQTPVVPQEPDRSPTPEPPPLAFPTAKRVSSVASPQPVELLGEESVEDPSDRNTKPIILTSGLGLQERIEYAELIERLGGTLLEKQQFDPACSHVVVNKPTRNEKFLAAVATGRWVLHKSYLIACRQERQFVREDDHEWGNPAMSQLMQSLDRQTLNLVQAAYRWRQKVHAIRKTDPGCKGAFQGWRAILLTEPRREDNFRRLLMAGGATVLSVKPPFGEVSATHVFVELHKVKLSDCDLQALVRGVDHILRPEFIAAHLTEKEPLPDNYTPAEIESLRFSMNSRKRKSEQSKDGSGSSKHLQ